MRNGSQLTRLVLGLLSYEGDCEGEFTGAFVGETEMRSSKTIKNSLLSVLTTLGLAISLAVPASSFAGEVRAQKHNAVRAALSADADEVGAFLDKTNSHRLRVASLAVEIASDTQMQEKFPWLKEYATASGRKRLFEGMLEHDYKKTEHRFSGERLKSGDKSVGEFLTRYNGVNKFNLPDKERKVFEATVEQFDRQDKAHMTETWNAHGFKDAKSHKRLEMLEKVADLVDTTEARAEEFGKKMDKASSFTKRAQDKVLAEMSRDERAEVLKMMRAVEQNPKIYARATRDIKQSQVVPVLRQLRVEGQSFESAVKKNFSKKGRPNFDLQISCEALAATVH